METDTEKEIEAAPENLEDRNPEPAQSETGAEEPQLGYLELMRADEPEESGEPDPTDRVLSRPRHSAWEF